MKDPQKLIEDKPMVVRDEHISFEINGTYMDAVAHTDYVDITIGGSENEKFSVTLKDWMIINKLIIKLIKQG